MMVVLEAILIGGPLIFLARDNPTAMFIIISVIISWVSFCSFFNPPLFRSLLFGTALRWQSIHVPGTKLGRDMSLVGPYRMKDHRIVTVVHRAYLPWRQFGRELRSD
mmetsp:Transcript_1927/g.3458  ORF Transcript_1927/g.3458 Transcript_1927/m.3458 type:complete len:107 (-) Transcript_1927:1862-2182(-)